MRAGLCENARLMFVVALLLFLAHFPFDGDDTYIHSSQKEFA